MSKKKFLSMDDKRHIKNIVDILDLANIVYSDLAKDGRSEELKKTTEGLESRCIMHSEKTPSLKFSGPKQMFYCFGCGDGGDIFGLPMKAFGLSFPESVQYLGKHFPKVQAILDNINPDSVQEREVEEIKFDPDSKDIGLLVDIMNFTQSFFRDQLNSNKMDLGINAREYLQKRGLWEYRDLWKIGFCPDNDAVMFQMMDHFGIKRKELSYVLKQAGLVGSTGFNIFQGRITFPICTKDGVLVSYSARRLVDSKDDSSSNKYKNSANSVIFSKSHFLYGLNEISSKKIQDFGVILVEGITDKYGFIKQGFKVALSQGSSALSENHYGLINAMGPKVVYIIPDGDTPGVQGAIRNSNRLVSTGYFKNPESSGDSIPIYVVPINEVDKDPFDLFFTEERDAKSYVQRNAMSPREFFNRLSDEQLLRAGVENPYSFLEGHCYHIVPKESMRRRFPQVSSQRETKMNINEPHPFIFHSDFPHMKSRLYIIAENQEEFAFCYGSV